MNSSIIIPKTINVGYQKRSDTYTGKLAYIVYYDENGKLRKEASWNSWRVGEEICKSRDYDDIPRERTLFGYCTMPDYIHIDFPYGKHHWFAYKNSESGFYKWKFTQFKSLPKNKLIICADSEFSQEYSEIYEEMIRKKEFSPRDLDNQKYVRYTYEEFVKYANEESCRFRRKYRLNDRFFSDQHFEYQIVHDDETMLWTAILASRYTKKNIEDYHNRFKFEKKAHSSDSQIVPMSIEELYTRLKPCYRETYLENGFLYEREDFYGNEEK